MYLSRGLALLFSLVLVCAGGSGDAGAVLPAVVAVLSLFLLSFSLSGGRLLFLFLIPSDDARAAVISLPLRYKTILRFVSCSVLLSSAII